MNKTLLKNCRFLITKPYPDGVIENGAVYVEGSQIKAVGQSLEIEKMLESSGGIDILDCSNKIVMPGLIDSHNHLANFPFQLIPAIEPPTYIGEIFDIMDLMIWPAYSWVDEEKTHDLTLWSMVNLLKHGTTTSTNAFPFPEAVYHADEKCRMRLVMQPQMVTRVRLKDGLDENGYLASTASAIQKYHNSLGGLFQVSVHISAYWEVTESLALKAMQMAKEYDVQFASHLLEAWDERKKMDEIWGNAGGPVKVLKDKGLINERTLLFHCSWLTNEEIDMIADLGSAVAHNPESNAEYGDVAYVPRMLQAGVPVGLGTDIPTSNLFNQMYLTKYLQNCMPRDIRRLDPGVPLELATIGSASALGLEDKIGTLEVGKQADIITIDLIRNTSLFPLMPNLLLDQIVTKGAGTVVTDAMVDGVFLRRNNEFTFLDEDAIISRTNDLLSEFAEYYSDLKKSGKAPVVFLHDEFVWT